MRNQHWKKESPKHLSHTSNASTVSEKYDKFFSITENPYMRRSSVEKLRVITELSYQEFILELIEAKSKHEISLLAYVLPARQTVHQLPQCQLRGEQHRASV